MEISHLADRVNLEAKISHKEFCQTSSSFSVHFVANRCGVEKRSHHLSLVGGDVDPGLKTMPYSCMFLRHPD